MKSLNESIPTVHVTDVEKIGPHYYIKKELAHKLGLRNGDNIVVKLGGWFNKVRGYVAETIPKSDTFHIIPYDDIDELLREELKRGKQLMGLKEVRH